MAKKLISVKLNSAALECQLREAIRKNPKVTTQKVTAIAMDLAGKSARMAPVESGDLRNNCMAEIGGKVIFENQTALGTAIRPSTKPLATVGYSLPYALRQHEEVGYRHDRKDGYKVSRVTRYLTQDGQVSTFLSTGSVNMVPGGEGKFLEKPYAESEEQYIKLLESIPDEVLK